MPDTIVPLTNGLWEDGRWHGQAVVRPLTGADEALLVAAAVTLPAERVTILLAAATQAIGDVRPVSEAIARQLTVGDRERVVLALHAITFGARLDVVARCTGATCGELIEVSLNLTDLLQGQAQGPCGPEHALAIAVGSKSFRVRFRLPSGGDQEAACRLAHADSRPASDQLLSRCITSLTDEQGNEASIEAAPNELHSALEDAFRTLDPFAENIATLSCPACGHTVTVILDAVTLLSGELARSGSIVAEVDRLARAYHWSEADILALPVARRRGYLSLLNHSGALA